MQPEIWDFESPATWLRFAKSDLELAAQRPNEDVLYETLCFHTQQVIEKSLKAVALHFGLNPPRTHIIAAWIDLIADRTQLPPQVMAATNLSSYASTTRYPGDYEPLNMDDYARALVTAEAVFHWAEELCLPQRLKE